MLRIIALAALLACATSAPASPPADESTAQITNYSNQINADGSYAYQFDTSNGINTQGTGTATGTAQGAVKYLSPEGEPIELSYVADENGYQPTGSHIPVAPPAPEYIERALEYIRAHPPPPEATQKL